MAMKTHNIVTLILCAYLATMAYWARDLILIDNDFFEYFFLLAVSLIIVIILRYTIKLRNKNRDDD